MCSRRRAEPARREPLREQRFGRRLARAPRVRRALARRRAGAAARVAAAHGHGFAVDEDVLRVVEHARAPVERDGARPPRRRAFREPDVRLRLAQHLAERARDGARPAASAARRRPRSGERRGNRGRRRRSRLPRVAIERRIVVGFGEPLSELAAKRRAAAHACRSSTSCNRRRRRRLRAPSPAADREGRPARARIPARRRSGAASSAARARRARRRTGARCASAACRVPATGTRRSCRRAGRRRRRRWPTRSSGRRAARRARSEIAATANARRRGASRRLARAGPSRLAQRRKARACDRPLRQRPIALVANANESRLHVVARAECEQLRSRQRWHEAGIALRTSKGWRCQWRRMNSRGVRPPSSGSARSGDGGRTKVLNQILLESVRCAGYKRAEQDHTSSGRRLRRPRIGAQRAANGSRATQVSRARLRRSAQLAVPGRHARRARAARGASTSISTS